MKHPAHLTTRSSSPGTYAEIDSPGVSLWWLGQAGFLIRFKGKNILIDPYLSDALAEKYRGKSFPHIRMMPSPIAMEDLQCIDFCLCSHAHSDHMDPGLLPVLAEVSPACRFICPEAVAATALERGVPSDRLTGMNAGDSMELGAGLMLSAVPAAHEEIRKDEEGHHYFLGFILSSGDLTIFHPGDCLPYDGLDSWLDPFRIDLALMPVNGRKEELSSQGIAGNFNIAQACRIMEVHRIPFMIPHHFGMFEFNTVSRESIAEGAESEGTGSGIFPAETGIVYTLVREY